MREVSSLKLQALGISTSSVVLHKLLSAKLDPNARPLLLKKNLNVARRLHPKSEEL
jgi:hypothetical protein